MLLSRPSPKWISLNKPWISVLKIYKLRKKKRRSTPSPYQSFLFHRPSSKMQGSLRILGPKSLGLKSSWTCSLTKIWAPKSYQKSKLKVWTANHYRRLLKISHQRVLTAIQISVADTCLLRQVCKVWIFWIIPVNLFREVCLHLPCRHLWICFLHHPCLQDWFHLLLWDFLIFHHLQHCLHFHKWDSL